MTREADKRVPQPDPEPAHDGLEGLSGPTRNVDIPTSSKTITEYLSQRGMKPGVELEGGEKEDFSAASVLHVGGGRKYQVGDVVAEGGMGVIYKAKDLNCRRTVAMKVMPRDRLGDTHDLLRFIEEGQIASQLEHPNIVPVHEMGLDPDGNVFYTMKFVKGVTLTEVLIDIRKGRQETIEKYPLATLLTIFQKACDAVAFAHSKNVIHRDLKPDNIMIGNFGEVLVMDWGLAKLLPAATPGAAKPPKLRVRSKDGKRVLETSHGDQVDESAIESIRTDDLAAGLRTISGRVMGTPGFMAPEQALPESAGVDERSDIYSLGAILYSMLVLRPPVTGKEIKELLRKIVAGDIRAPADHEGPLPHCPGGSAPGALSDICMKAMELSPEHRYAGVKELQQEVEAYQHGLIWHLLIDEDFSSSDILSRWEVVGGQHELVDGELRLYGGEPQILLLRREVAADVRIEFECHQESVYLNDVGCFMSAIRSENGKEIPSSGYEFKHGGYDNSLNVLMRSDQKIWSRSASPLVRGKRFRVVAERIGPRLRMVVNNEEVFRVTDKDPLSGADRTAVGLLGWMADTRYSSIRVYALGTPWKSDILDVAERQLQKGRYTSAMDLFREVMESYPEPERQARAKQGYETAANRENMMRNLPVWRERVEQAWPGTGSQVRMDNDGLTVEISNHGISDLSPLRGMPITTLYCECNRITSLEPLRGMPLVKLNCAGNAIASLEPLRGMPLVTLLCDYCRIASLEPLKGMSLTMLNCGGNPLVGGLEPLRGIELAWLSCWGTGISSLEPLRGMPINTLYCDGNRIDTLEPLRGMPLSTLFCMGNRIRHLDPLKGMQLTALHCASNDIESLEPLRGMTLTIFSCHCNRISDLSPLEGMPLGALMCGNNPLKSLGALVERPPESLSFECEAIPDAELERMRGLWTDSARHAHLAGEIDVLLSLRRGDLRGLKSLATGFRGHYYLYIPRMATWEEAKTIAERLGAHLVTIPSLAINDFIAGLFPRGSWFWIGLETLEDGTQQWVTGEPFTFSKFVDALRERKLGPKVFYGSAWSADVFGGAHNCFMIEWDN